ncbi:hypothetical protein D9758_018538 [Tetrapyrgos nigripes]|uniref:Carbonic anhydrase n=1 Tax=Tetrapyrgos nigripes TaxID=182062 RepID=A0A8H5AYV6_9AGAR|nr:hypothetical protein D9758_018538 [Tetrapyrgos nigripes]
MFLRPLLYTYMTWLESLLLQTRTPYYDGVVTVTPGDSEYSRNRALKTGNAHVKNINPNTFSLYTGTIGTSSTNSSHYAENHKGKVGEENWDIFRRLRLLRVWIVASSEYEYGLNRRCRRRMADVDASPQKQLGLADSDTTIIRNGGGEVRELIRSILITQNFGTRHFVLIKHTDCGYFNTTIDEVIKGFKAHAKDPNAIDALADKIRPENGPKLSIDKFVLRDVEYLRESPFDLSRHEGYGMGF